MGVTDESIRQAVQQRYGDVARRFVEEPPQAGCCGPSPAVVESLAPRFYSADEVDGLPQSITDASLGCGNPTAIAELQPGETVLDLGSGGGIDCFLAARRVGPEGHVIGLDMTPDMIKLARRNAKGIGATNVEFRYGEMEEMPLPEESVDVIISNCVINLSPDKDAVFHEAYRVLRPGGRMSVSDLVTNGALPQAVRSQMDSWAACIAGALAESVYLDKIRAAGFERVEVISRDPWGVDEPDEAEEPQLAVDAADGRVVEGEEAQALLDQSGASPREIAQRFTSVVITAYKPT
jgi:arsenite methyltransferase